MMKKQNDVKHRFNKKKIIWFTLIPAIILIIVFFLFFPPFIKGYLINSLKGMGLKNPQLTIRHVGLSQFDIQHFSVGREAKTGSPGLTVSKLAIDFSWPALLKNRIQKIEITGMTVNAIAGKDSFTILGLEPLFEKKEKSKPTMPFDQVDISNSVINLVWQGHTLTIPFSLSAKYSTGEKITDFLIDLTPYGDIITAKGTIKMDPGTGKITVNATQLDLGKYFNDLNISFCQWLKSRLKLNAEINISDWGIKDSNISLATSAFSVRISEGNVINGSVNLNFKLNRDVQPEDVQLKLRIENINDKIVQVEIPFTLDISGRRLNDLQVKLNHLELKDPPGIQFRDFKGTASLDINRLQVQGDFDCGISPEFITWLSPDLNMEGGLALNGNFRVLADDKGTTWGLTGRGGGKILLTSHDIQAAADKLSISLDASGNENKMENRLDIDLENMSITYKDLAFSAASMNFNNNFNSNDRKNWTGWGNLKMDTAQVKQKDGIDAHGMYLDLPWQYPFTSTKPGNWHIDSLKLGNLDLGKVSGEIKQKDIGLDFSGNVRTPIEPLKVNMSGSFQWSEKGSQAMLQMDIPPTLLTKDSQLKRLHPGFAGYLFSGSISGNANVSYVQETLKSGAKFKLNDLEIESDTGGIKSQGVNAEITFTDLLNFKTDVEQRINFKSIDVSGLILNKGHLTFEIISPNSIYVEGGEFAFSDGRVLLQPLRYDLNGKNLKISIYGDRINFAALINKLQGEQIAFGKAELNGLLTVRISDGIPVFRDGYLYSTPGVGGNIKFTRSETISGGVLLVEEAVKNFNYEWIKLKLDTIKNKLNVTAFINGVPAEKLPLTYDMKTENIIRDAEGKRTLELKGLLLELRFKDLDLKRLMRGGFKIYTQENEKKNQNKKK